MSENNYIKQYPDIMSGKKILYVHGFCSSGQSGTVTKLKEFLPETVFITPDIPLHPQEAIDLLHKICEEEKPDLIIGTSMGGMYAEMLYGFDRILVNPAFQMGDTILKNNMLGKNTILNPRKDGIQDFIMTKSMLEEYKEITGLCFTGVNKEERDNHVYGLFGDNDPTVHTFDLFSKHYTNAIHFHGAAFGASGCSSGQSRWRRFAAKLRHSSRPPSARARFAHLGQWRTPALFHQISHLPIKRFHSFSCSFARLLKRRLPERPRLDLLQLGRQL